MSVGKRSRPAGQVSRHWRGADDWLQSSFQPQFYWPLSASSGTFVGVHLQPSFHLSNAGLAVPPFSRDLLYPSCSRSNTTRSRGPQNSATRVLDRMWLQAQKQFTRSHTLKHLLSRSNPQIPRFCLGILDPRWCLQAMSIGISQDMQRLRGNCNTL